MRSDTRKAFLVIATSDRRSLDREWRNVGGAIAQQPCTGEVVYSHPAMSRRIRVNGRKKQSCAVVLSKLNQLLRDGMTADMALVRRA